MGVESNNKSNKPTIINDSLRNFKAPSNSGVSDVRTLSLFEDPTYLGFKLSFTGIDNNDFGGLLGGKDNKNSARYYLNQIGDDARYKQLDTFISLLRDINTSYPWYWQEITGLDDTWKRKESFTKARINKEITIACLESLDLRISALIDLYRKSAYDFTNRREILTDNLREFEMSIIVYDTRTFNIAPEGTKILGNDGGDISKQTQVNQTFFGENENEQSHFIFNLAYCEFNMDSGSDMFSTINNRGNEAATQSMTISYQHIEEGNLFKILSMLYRSDNDKFWYVKDYVGNLLTTLANQGNGKFDLSTLGGGNINVSPSVQSKGSNFARDKIEQVKAQAGEFIGNITDNFAQDLQRDATGLVANAVSSNLNSLFLGNVYGFSAGSLLANVSGNASGIAVNAAADTTKNTLGNVID